MRWDAQVLHVARKDARMARWLLLGYVAVVGVATASSVTARDFVLGPIGWTFFIVMLGMVLFAVLVQEDSPALTDTFWVTRPLRPSAVFAAKLLLTLVALVATALVGQTIGLRVHDVAAGSYVALLADSALTYGVGLAMAAVVASLTRDLRSFLVTFVAFIVGTVVLISLIEFRSYGGDVAVSGSTSGPPSRLTIALPVVAMLLLVVHQYLTRHVKRGVVLAIALLLAGYAVTPFTAPTPTPLPTIPTELRGTPVAADVRPAAIPGLELVQATIGVRIEGGSDRYRYGLVISSPPLLQRRDGSADTVQVNAPSVVMQVPLFAEANFRWLGAGPDTVETVIVNLTPAQAEEVRRGDAQLLITGGVDVREMTQLGTFPLSGGHTMAQRGLRMRVSRATFMEDGPMVEVALSKIYSSSLQRRVESLGDPARGFEFVLVNEEGREAFPLTPGWTSGRGFGLVLPGPNTWSMNLRLRPHLPGLGKTTDAPAREWLRNAQLRVVHWTSVGHYPVEIAARVHD